MTEKALEHAWKYGHFRNPDYAATHEVSEKDIATLTLDDELSKQAIMSVQASDGNLPLLCDLLHGRELSVDGDCGPATEALIALPRCAVPDFGNEYGKAGSGGWSKCDETMNFDHEVVIKFDDRQATGKWPAYMDQVKRAAVDISGDVGLSVRYIAWDSGENFQSSVIFKNIPGGVIGFYYLPQGEGCRRISQGALDTSYQPDVTMASLLWIHEGLGHGIGLQHTNGGIMNASLMRTKISWRNDPSWNAVKRLYGGEPIFRGPPPEPPDDPTPPDKPKVLFEFVAKEAGQKFAIVTGDQEDKGWKI